MTIRPKIGRRGVGDFHELLMRISSNIKNAICEMACALKICRIRSYGGPLTLKPRFAKKGVIWFGYLLWS